jgi:hypothetical protein
VAFRSKARLFPSKSKLISIKKEMQGIGRQAQIKRHERQNGVEYVHFPYLNNKSVPPRWNKSFTPMEKKFHLDGTFALVYAIDSYYE